MITNTVVGHETTSHTLQWCFFYLSKHPDVLAKARAELSDIFENSTPEAVIVNDIDTVLQKLVLVTAIIKETLRLCTPASTVRQPTSFNPVPVEINGSSVLLQDMLYQTSLFLLKSLRLIVRQ